MEPKPPSPEPGPDMTNFEGWPDSWGASADEPQPVTPPTTVWIMNTSRPISLRVRGIVTNSSGRRIDVDAPSRDELAYLAAASAPSPEMAPAQPASDAVSIHSVVSSSEPLPLANSAGKALEFAEYMAKGAEHALDAINAEFVAAEAVECADDDDALSDEENALRFLALEGEAEHARQCLSDALTGLRSDIYEFRKRAAKVAPSERSVVTDARPDEPKAPSAAPQPAPTTSEMHAQMRRLVIAYANATLDWDWANSEQEAGEHLTKKTTILAEIESLFTAYAAQGDGAASQMLGMYAEQAEEIRAVLDELAPQTAGNLQTRLRAALAPQPAPSEPVAFQPTDLERIIDSYLEDYELRDLDDGGDHTPSEFERFVIKDAIQGLLVDPDWDAAWGKLIDERVSTAPQPADAVLRADAERYRWLKQECETALWNVKYPDGRDVLRSHFTLEKAIDAAREGSENSKA